MSCKCPKCKSEIVRRKRRKGIYRLVPYIKYYSCFKCKVQFYNF